MRSVRVEVIIERAHHHDAGASFPKSFGSFLLFSCATTLVQRTCCDLKGIPLADNTLKTAEHLGPGNELVVVFNAFAFSL